MRTVAGGTPPGGADEKFEKPPRRDGAGGGGGGAATAAATCSWADRRTASGPYFLASCSQSTSSRSPKDATMLSTFPMFSGFQRA